MQCAMSHDFLQGDSATTLYINEEDDQQIKK